MFRIRSTSFRRLRPYFNLTINRAAVRAGSAALLVVQGRFVA
jgi:hypothetical protein